MPNQTRFPRLALVLILFLAVCGGTLSSRLGIVEQASAKPAVSGTMDVIINEIAWSGTLANVNAEWIELYNPGGTAIDMNGWTLSALDGTPNITLTGTISANGYYLLERTADTTVSNIPADQIYTGALGNTVENLELRDNNNTLIDTANESSASWFAGTAGPTFSSMERSGIVTDSLSAWGSNNGIIINGLDSGGNPIQGTPRQQNSNFSSYSPLSILINEVAWAGTVASSDDEWIELYNPGASAIDLTGWRLTAADGSPDITLSGSIPAGGYYLLERGHSGVTNQPHDLIFFGALGDTNEILRLRAPDGTLVDTANSNGSEWPAGLTTPASSMERVGGISDGDFSWATSTGNTASDAGGNPINGTPGGVNSMQGFTPTTTPSPTFTPTNTSTPTNTPTSTPTITPTSSVTRSVIINEVAWAGTASGLPDDEWIELYNPGSSAISLAGWTLKTSDGIPTIILSGTIPAGGYFLIERDDDTTVSDVTADLIYDQTTTEAFSNSGEALTLYDGSNKVIDTANGNGGGWPAGSSSTYGTMERNNTNADSDSNWHTNTGSTKNGKNANGGDILGTPKSGNSPLPSSSFTATPEPTDTPTLPPPPVQIDPRPIINEVLARPGFDWNLDGKADVFDEFIEIKNLTAIDISLSGWRLDKFASPDEPSQSFSLPALTLKPGERIVFYSKETNLLLSDGGETVRLINASGKVYDAFTYEIARAEDKSFCRLPDGNPGDSWFEDCLPTPNLANTREGKSPESIDGAESPVCNLPDTIPLDFFIPECNGYGADIWNPFYWDQISGVFRKWIQDGAGKWDTFIE